jgi:hypothetical protein
MTTAWSIPMTFFSANLASRQVLYADDTTAQDLASAMTDCNG